VPDFALSLATLLPHSGTPYIVLVIAGFAIGFLGHLSTSRWLVAIGVILIFLGALLFPLALNITERTPPQIEKRADEAE
jgi:energy-coupling factor transporter transmembrane protein EcfT